jgi:DNA-binding transcriptional LysR family regulator
VELRRLSYFVAVAEELNFGRAAQRLHITQPGLSQSIRALEREIGMLLFERTRHSVELSPAGVELLPAVRKLLAHADEVQRLADHLSSTNRRSLRLSDTRSAGVGLPSQLLAAFRKRHPKIMVEVSSGFTSLNVQHLRSREIDAAFVRPPIDAGDDLHCLVLAHEPVLLAVPVGHRLAEQISVQPEDLDGEPLVFFPRESGGLWTSILTAVYGPHAEPEISRVEPDEPHMLAAVAEGAGITLLTESAAAMLTVADAVMKPFKEPVTVPLAIAWCKDNKNPALRSFLAMAHRRMTETG